MNDQGVISVRFGPEQACMIRDRAAELGLSVSEYLRHIASRDAILSRPGARRWVSATGAEFVFWSNATGATG